MPRRYSFRLSVRDSRQADKTLGALPPPGTKLTTRVKVASLQIRSLSSVGRSGKSVNVESGSWLSALPLESVFEFEGGF